MIVEGGKQYYGEAIGIALFDGRRYPILPGDVANASTSDYPVRLKVIEGLFDTPTPWDKTRAVPADIQKIIDAVKSLEDDGVRAVVTACGFFSVVQEVLAFAQRHGADGVVTSAPVAPRLNRYATRINRELPLWILDGDPFVELPRTPRLGRFSRYWREAEPVVWESFRG